MHWYLPLTFTAVGLSIALRAGYFRWKRHNELEAASSRLLLFWETRILAPQQWPELSGDFPKKEHWPQAIADYQLLRRHQRYANQLPPGLWRDLGLYPWMHDASELEKMN
jgi:hypothetical protein